MLRRTLLVGLPLLVASTAAAEPFSITASDGTIIFGDRLPASGTRLATLLLFHMAGSNFAEYAPLAPQFAARGFETLAIDARSGGRAFGRDNATVTKLRRSTDFAAALPDLRAAYAFARSQNPTGKIIAIGSSYSAALVFLLAASTPDLTAIAAFSPGEFIAGASIRDAASHLKCPCYVTSASDSGEINEAKRLAAAVPGGRGQHVAPRQGLHGASSLRADQNPGGAATNIADLMAFLSRVATA